MKTVAVIMNKTTSSPLAVVVRNETESDNDYDLRVAFRKADFGCDVDYDYDLIDVQMFEDAE